MRVFDKLRRKERSKSPLPPPSPAPADLPIRPTIEARTEPGQRIFDAAIRSLKEEDQAAIKELVGKQDVGDVKAAQDAILSQQRLCEEKRWTMQVGACTLSLGNVAGSVSAMLDKLKPGVKVVSEVVAVFKPGIDLAASIDPLHIGIPVAIIKAVLGVVVFSQEQMEKLLTGVKTAVYMLKQLSLYFEHFKHVEGAAQNYEELLAGSYSLVFKFLAVSQRALAKRGPKRAWELLWTKDTVDGFEKSCDAAGVELERAANHAGRADSVAAELRKMQQLDIITQTLRGLEIKVDLSRLVSAGGASYDYVSKDGTVYDYCLPGTRLKLIAEMVDWCHQPHQRLFWLSGMAGTGKSTLLRTVAQQIRNDGLLAATFFFRQDMAEQRDAALFVSTVCAQLISRWPILRAPVAEALDADRELPGGALSTQFTKLLLEPLRLAGLKVVLLVDALDECEPKHASIVLRELAKLAEEIDLRIVVTSRPEPEILKHFSAFAADGRRLESIPEEETEEDIRLFLKTCFDEMVKEDAQQRSPQLYAGWPRSLEDAVQQTKPLFIFAATLVRYVRADDEPDECLAQLLRDGQQLKGMQQVYLPILRRIYPDGSVKFKERVGMILMARDPLSIEGLASLLALSNGALEKFFQPLRSVLQVPDNLTDPVRVLHKSFKDFLLEPGHDYWIYQNEAEDQVLDRCFQLMDCKLHKNLFDVRPGTQRDAVQADLPTGLAYACIHWVDHLVTLAEDTAAYRFLTVHFLHWLEAMSWLDRMGDVRMILTQCSDITRADMNRRAITTSIAMDFLNDATRFVPRFQEIMTTAPMQIYHAALAFAPINSIVRKTFQHEMILDMKAKLSNEQDWLDLLETIKFPPRRWRQVIAYSPDDKLLAIAAESGRIHLHETMTGISRSISVSLMDITDISFCLDSTQLLVWSYSELDHSVEWIIWDLEDDQETARGVTPGLPLAFAFPRKSTCVALTTWHVADLAGELERTRPSSEDSYDASRRSMWVEGREELHVELPRSAVSFQDLCTGEQLQYFENENGDTIISAGRLSTSANLAALVFQAGDDNHNIWLWFLKTNEQIYLDDLVDRSTLEISPDEKFLAYGKSDVVHLWSVAQRQRIRTIDAPDLFNLHILKDGTSMCIQSFESRRLHDLYSGNTSGHMNVHPQEHVAWGRQVMATAMYDGDKHQIKIRSIRGSLEETWHPEPVDAIILSADGKFAAITMGSRIELYETDTAKLLETQQIPPATNPENYLTIFAVGLPLSSGLHYLWLRHPRAIGDRWTPLDECFALSRDETTLALATPSVIVLYDAGIGEPLKRCKLGATQYEYNPVTHLTLSSRARYMYADGSRIMIDSRIEEEEETEPGLKVAGEWIQLYGESVLWAGQERLGPRYATTNTCLAVGRQSGAIDFYSVAQDKLQHEVTPASAHTEGRKAQPKWYPWYGELVTESDVSSVHSELVVMEEAWMDD